MIYSELDGVRISGIAAAVPENVVDIEGLKATEDPKMIDTFIKKTGTAYEEKCRLGERFSEEN